MFVSKPSISCIDVDRELCDKRSLIQTVGRTYMQCVQLKHSCPDLECHSNTDKKVTHRNCRPYMSGMKHSFSDQYTYIVNRPNKLLLLLCL